MSKRKADYDEDQDADMCVYSCKWSGDHAFTLDCQLEKLPMRRADNARIIDTRDHTVSLKLKPGPMKLIRRENGNIERQHRLILGRLPVAYRSSNESPFLYVMDDAVERLAPAAQGAAPVPPCVLAQKDGAGVIVDVDDKADSVGIITLRPDKLRVQLMSSVANARCNEELTSFLAKALDVRQERLAVTKGWYTRHKVVSVAGTSRDELYKQLQEAMEKGYMVDAVYKPITEPKNRH